MDTSGVFSSFTSRLRTAPVKIKFVTNTTKESVVTLHERLQRLGFDIRITDIFSSLTAARHLVIEGGLRPMLLLQDDAKKDFIGGVYFLYYSKSALVANFNF